MAIQHGIVEKMEPDLGKLFIGGISWDTDEDRLKEYFGNYGEVVETVIMRDRLTGRARGFGFVIFADPVVAEQVVMEKHVIDGRTVEAKKAVPREDHHGPNRNNTSSIQGSPNPGRTKKIFVGGLASTVTESEFKNYFDQFGTITDVVVMYDHNTQRPRGFGFITYDSEDAVDRVLHKTFHELSGKMVEVKRAVPKELSPSPNRSPLVGFNYGLGRPNNLLNTTFPQGYNMSSMGGYGVRMDGRFNSMSVGRTGFSPFGSTGHGMGLNLDLGLSPNYGGPSAFSNNLGYGRLLNPYYNANSNRQSTPIGYNQGNGRNDSFLSSSPRSVWGNGGLATSANSATYVDSGGSGNFGAFGNSGANWGSSPVSAHGGGGGGSSGYNGGSAGGYGARETNYVLGTGGLGRNSGPIGVAPTSGGGYDGPYGELYRGGSMYGERTWHSSSPDVDGTVSFSYGLDDAADVSGRSSEGYVGNYSIANRQSNRGIAT